MVPQEWVTNAVEADVSGFLTTEHRLTTPAGMLARFEIPSFRRDTVFQTPDGRSLAMRQASWWRGEFELLQGEVVLAKAWPRGFFHREIVIEFGERTYTLVPGRLLTRDWFLVDEAESPLLEICPQGIFRRGASITVQAEVPVELLVFAYYLVFQRWQTDAAAASAAAAGGAS